ncbi:MAG: plasmid stabilization system [Mucilaginibacter sp.]|nr:plasmid stabilization system [Mucilaginibacter sp.]MDB5017487.1 plasmid stabilization system [Mucilaginibacter sp.]MDB5139102.1 plasmid stabilization system [Mucilaginibacter sp.]
MVEIIWTPFALEDLQSIYDYIALDSPTYAIKFIDKLVDRVDILIENPESGKIVPEFEDELIRELIEGSYRIIYRIRATDEIGIVRVHHSARLLK